MSCSESWEISRSRYPESTSVAFSKSAWLFCKDRRRKKKAFLRRKKFLSSVQMKEKTGWVKLHNIQVTWSENHEWKSRNFILWSEQNLCIYQQVLCLSQSGIPWQAWKVFSLLAVQCGTGQIISHCVPCVFVYPQHWQSLCWLLVQALQHQSTAWTAAQ